MFIATFYQFGIAKFCQKQEITDVITQSKEAYELCITSRISEHRVNIALWKRISKERVAQEIPRSSSLNWFEIYLFEISFKSPRGQWVKKSRMITWRCFLNNIYPWSIYHHCHSYHDNDIYTVLLVTWSTGGTSDKPPLLKNVRW